MTPSGIPRRWSGAVFPAAGSRWMPGLCRRGGPDGPERKARARATRVGTGGRSRRPQPQKVAERLSQKFRPVTTLSMSSGPLRSSRRL